MTKRNKLIYHYQLQYNKYIYFSENNILLKVLKNSNFSWSADVPVCFIWVLENRKGPLDSFS